MAVFYPSERGGEKMTYMGYIYNDMSKCKNNIRRWRCEKRRLCKCKGAAKTLDTEVEVYSEHNHPPDFVKAEVDVAKRCLYDSVNESTGTDQISINSAMMPVSMKALALLPKHETIARTCRRRKRKAIQDSHIKSENEPSESCRSLSPKLNTNVFDGQQFQIPIINEERTDSDFEIYSSIVSSTLPTQIEMKDEQYFEFSNENEDNDDDDDSNDNSNQMKFETIETEDTLTIKFPNSEAKKCFMIFCSQFINIVKNETDNNHVNDNVN